MIDHAILIAKNGLKHVLRSLSILIIAVSVYIVNTYLKEGENNMYERLKTALEGKGISVYHLATLATIASPDLYNAISGKKPMYPNWRKRISEALEIPEEELFEKEGGHDGENTHD